MPDVRSEVRSDLPIYDVQVDIEILGINNIQGVPVFIVTN